MIRRRAIRLGSQVYNENRRLRSDAQSPLAAAATETGIPPLEDKLGRRHDYLRLSLTERCNLRCQYCMPAEGVPLCAAPALLSTEELTVLVEQFAALGVRKLRLTGGEPTLRKDLPQLIERLKGTPGIERVGMTSNGVALSRSLAALQRAGLDALNLSLDSLQPERYATLSRRHALPRVLACIDLALQLDYRPLKINTVLIKGVNDDEICDFVEFTRDREVEVRFIEFMPFSGNKWDSSRLVPSRAVRDVIRARYPALHELPARPNDTARMWQVPGHLGAVGLISSMTEHFCASCNRLRLTADGNLKVCLFGAAETSLRDALRGGASADQLRALIRAALTRKKPQHAGARCGAGAAQERERVRLQARGYCTATAAAGGEGAGVLTHADGAGRARMVDVGDKAVTSRRAAAACRVLVSATAAAALRANTLGKGDALAVAQVAGVLAAKRTASLLPLCHALPLDHAHVLVTVPGEEEEEEEGARGTVAVRVECRVRATARTGAEMEALTGAAVAALALYDMCKSVDKGIVIEDLRLLTKSGGKSDYPNPPSPPAPGHAGPGPGAGELPDPPLRRQPRRDLDDTYAPVNFGNF